LRFDSKTAALNHSATSPYTLFRTVARLFIYGQL